MIPELSDFKSIPVDIETFITDSQYLGNALNGGLYPYWLDRLKEIYPRGLYVPAYSEVLLSGALGTGKSVAAVVGFLYDLYLLTMLKNPHETFKLCPISSICLAVITADGSNTLLADIIADFIGMSTYFMSLLPSCKDSPLSTESLKPDMFPNNVGIARVFSTGTILGRTLFGGIVDDTGLMLKKASVDKVRSGSNFYEPATVGTLCKVTELYESVWRRSVTRFMASGGGMPCRMWLATGVSSMLDALVERRVSRSVLGVYTVSPAIWEALEHKGIYCGAKFLMDVGTETAAPRIVEDATGLPNNRVVSVPVEYEREFEKDACAALRDLAGIRVKYSRTDCSWDIVNDGGIS